MAFSLAKLYENQHGQGKFNMRNSKAGPLLQAPSDNTKGIPIVRKMLTIEERKERSAKGLCFNYDEAYSLGHKCKG